MKLESYREQLGGVVGNLHSLEFVLRAFLQQLPSARPFGLPHGTDIYNSPVGTELPENELTNYDSLNVLIERFNKEMALRGLQGVDPSIVDLRDALAHGRVSAASPESHLRLLKFDRPINGRVRVTFNAELDEAWFKDQTKRTYQAIELVAKQLNTPIAP